MSFSRNAKLRRDKRLRQLAQMRAAKARRRLERIADGWDPEPRMKRWFPLELGLRNKFTGETAWVDFKSLRDALRRLGIVKRHYQPLT
jgi:hypothetical protein